MNRWRSKNSSGVRSIFRAQSSFTYNILDSNCFSPSRETTQAKYFIHLMLLIKTRKYCSTLNVKLMKKSFHFIVICSLLTLQYVNQITVVNRLYHLSQLQILSNFETSRMILAPKYLESLRFDSSV